MTPEEQMIQDIFEQFGPAFFIGYGIFMLVMLILFIVVYWRIFSKAGYNGALGCLMFVPLVNIIMFLYLAFAEWPIEKENKALKAGQAGGYPQQPMGGYPQQGGQYGGGQFGR